MTVMAVESWYECRRRPPSSEVLDELLLVRRRRGVGLGVSYAIYRSLWGTGDARDEDGSGVFGFKGCDLGRMEGERETALRWSVSYFSSAMTKSGSWKKSAMQQRPSILFTHR